MSAVRRIGGVKVWLLLLVGCTTVPNPKYCDEPSDCNNGRTCNLETHACELVDASIADAPIDAVLARTVQEVRSDSTPDGTLVDLTNVIVIGVDQLGSGLGTLWVQQPGAGPSSGINIIGANPAAAALLNFGDVIDVSGGRKEHYTHASDFSGRSVLRISPHAGEISITAKGSNVAPIWAEIDHSAIAMMTPQEIDTELEKFAGSYVRAQYIKATGELAVVAGDYVLPLGPVFLRRNLAEFPSGAMAGTCFTSIKGVLDYAGKYVIQPQFTLDMEIGTGCL
jgi:hypothetical protein